MHSLDEALADARPFLHAIIREAGEVLMRHFRRAHDTRAKVGNDIVTEADLESEDLIAGAIRERFPDHALIAEEGSRAAPDSDFCWYIDPLDGTVNYAAGVPVFAVAIALAHRGEPVLGAILDPTRDQLFWAERAAGATCNGRPIAVGGTRMLSDALVYLSAFGLRRDSLAPHVLAALSRLGPETRNIVNLGSAGIAWAYVAAGYIDGEISFAVDQFTGPAGILLVREAGGRATDFAGRDWLPGTPNVVASNDFLHRHLLEMAAPPEG